MNEYVVHINKLHGGMEEYQMKINAQPHDKIIEGRFEKILSDFIQYQEYMDGKIILNFSGLQKSQSEPLNIVINLHNSLEKIKRISNKTE